MSKETEFKPYIPAEKVTAELTVTSIIVGVVLAVVFGAANAYLGLRVGMTVSASIPAAVISMGVIRLILRRNSILENNMSQTIGSAGESLAAGAIFTLPALFLWAAEGKCEAPGLLEITVIAVCSGVLGVLFMIPLRNALIVKEHATLPYPEGTACADVLLAGEEGGTQARAVVAGIGIAAVLKFIVDGLKIVSSKVTLVFSSLKGEVSMGAYPALVGVGYIVGHKVSAIVFAGSVVSWMVIIPLICFFGGDQVIAPGTDPVSYLYAQGGATEIWSNYVRYIGAGAIVTGGIISLIKTMPVIVSTFKDSLANVNFGGRFGAKGRAGAGTKSTGAKGRSDTKGAGMSKGANATPTSTPRTAQDFPLKFVLLGSLAIILILWLVPFIKIDLLSAVIIVIFGFFFATVSSRMVGVVGSSNNPASGMAIATLLIATLLLQASGNTGIDGMQTAMVITSVVCIVACMAGDTSQDLKTGYLLGATPKKQQIGLFIGAIAAALAIGGILYLLNSAWGFGTEDVPAPQAMLMKTIVEGVMGGDLPWNLVFIGVFLALGLELLGVSVISFAIGVYLPISTTSTLIVGGVIRWIMDKRREGCKSADAGESEGVRAGKGKAKRKLAGVSADVCEAQIQKGTLFSAGLIAGEGLMGIALAVCAVLNVTGAFDLSSLIDIGNVGPAIILLIMIVFLLKYSVFAKVDVGAKSSVDSAVCAGGVASTNADSCAEVSGDDNAKSDAKDDAQK